ncbi:MAG: PASTA domain-containing protein [Betaproteobacteria bacterium]|nr:PASTA domain-containing protein [Betaproteobacteria bacterium]
MTTALDLTALIGRLREAGFRVDTRQFLSANELLVAMARHGRVLDGSSGGDNVGTIVSSLGPVFCTSPEEQVRFPEIVRDWLGAAPGRPIEPSLPRGLPIRPGRLLLLLTGPLVAALVIVAMLGWPLWWMLTEVAIQGLVVRATVDATGDVNVDPVASARLRFRGAPVAVDAEGRFVLHVPRHARALPLEARLEDQSTTLDVSGDTASPLVLRFEVPAQTRTSVVPASQRYLLGEPRVFVPPTEPARVENRRNVGAALGAGLGSGAAVFGVLWWYGRHRRRAALRRMPVSRRPDIVSLARERAQPSAFARPVARGLVRSLRRPRAEDARDLHVERTIQATARGGGLLSPVYLPRKQLPEYLFLIGRHGHDDHQARLADAMVTQLEQAGLSVERYYFEDDPRVCRGVRDSLRQRPLTELAGTHHHFTLVVLGEARALLDPLSGEPAPWLGTLNEWPRRVLFTPAPPAHWTRSEWTLAATGLTVLPWTAAGIRTYADLTGEWRIESLFPAPYARAYPGLLTGEGRQWLSPNAPAPETAGRLLRQLRGYLGPEGFSWLCACAVYPQLSWALTLALAPAGEGDGADERLFDSMLPRLARLPWFRYGRMPDWLRLALITRLAPNDEARVRNQLTTLLGEMARRAGVPGEAAISVAAYAPPGDLLASEPSNSRLRDAVFLGFVSGASLDRLSVEAPGDWWRLFPRAGALPTADMPAPPRKSFWGRLAEHLVSLKLFRPALLRGAISIAVTVVAFTMSWNGFVQEVRTPAPSQEARTLAVSPDGRYLVLGTDARKLWLWDLSRPDSPPLVLVLDSMPRTLTFQARARPSAPAAAADARPPRSVPGFGTAVAAEAPPVSGSPVTTETPAARESETRLAMGLEDGSVRLWTLGTPPDSASRLDPQGAPVTQIVFYDDSTLASLGANGQVRFREEDGGTLPSFPYDRRRGVTHLARVANPDRMVFGYPDGTVSVVGPQTRKASSRELPGDGAVTALAADSGGRWLAVARADGSVQIWDSRSDAIVGRFRLPSTESSGATSGRGTGNTAAAVVRTLAFSPDGTVLAVATGAAGIHLRDTFSGRALEPPINTGEDVVGLAIAGGVSPDALHGGAAGPSAGSSTAGSRPRGMQLVASTNAGANVWPFSVVSAPATVPRSTGPSGKAPPKRVTVPGVTGMTLDQARKTLAGIGLEVQVPGAPDGGGVVRAQKPGAGATVASGTAVLLDVPTAPATVTVPDVRGQPLDRALTALKKERLEGSVTGAATKEPGSVVDQQPAPGTRVTPGSRVELFLDSGKGADYLRSNR